MYLPDDKMALTFVDSKAFASVSQEAFRLFSAKAGLPEKITRDTVEETVLAFARSWRDRDIEALDEKNRRAIDKHLATVPMWTEFAGHR